MTASLCLHVVHCGSTNDMHLFTPYGSAAGMCKLQAPADCMSPWYV